MSELSQPGGIIILLYILFVVVVGCVFCLFFITCNIVSRGCSIRGGDICGTRDIIGSVIKFLIG